MAKLRRNKKVRIFENSIEKLGRILSSKWKVKVVFKAGECKTCGQVIYLPVLPDNASPELMEAMHGYLDHETAHVIFTDFTIIEKLSRSDKKLFTVINALEDPRVERKMGDVWRGSTINLRNSREWALKKMTEKRETVDPATGNKIMATAWDNLSDFGKVLMAASIYTSVKFDDNHWFISTIVEPDVLAKVKQCVDILKDALNGDNTDQVRVLAKQFMTRLSEVEDPSDLIDAKDIPDDAIILPPGAGMSPQEQTMLKKPPVDPNAPMVVQQEFGDADSGEDGEDGDPHTITSDADEGDPGARASGTTSGQRSKPRNYNPSAKELANDAKISSTGEMIKEAASREFSGRDGYLISTTEGDKLEIIKDGDRVAYKEFMLEAREMVSVVKRKMSRSLLSTNISRWEGDKTRGKINPRAIFRVSIGTSKRVFRQKVEAEDFDTVIQIMVDHSGSMSGPKLELAAKTSIILGEVAHQLKIPFSVMGFSTGDSYVASKRWEAADHDARNTYVRWGDQWIGVYKEFDELWMQNNHKLINMVDNQRHNTYDGESLRYAAQRLLGRKEKRKILFWLNDGEPCPNGVDDGPIHDEYAKLCAQEVEKTVELLAIGIQTDAVKNFYSNYVVVHDVQDLPSLCLGQLDDMLRKGKKLLPNAKKKAA